MTKGELSNHIALVTGATGGIGTAICHILASHGCSVSMHYNSDQGAAFKLLWDLKQDYEAEFGSKFCVYKADLADYDQVRDLHTHTIETIGPPTILINNAGTTGSHHFPSTIEEIPIEEFERTWRINCGSAYLLTQLCMPAMEGEGWGRVVFISSVAGFTGGLMGPHYASSKSALHGLVHWTANAYANKGVTVNGVAPALIERTKMLPEQSMELTKRIPMGRLGTPEEVAETVFWMLKTAFVTNKIIGVDGGLFPQ
ncbi:3-oxoacyl-reductase [Westerdykella ornata]|uniref:3-oxoacyl-[acyl-carrier-protein] reductase n=1 Tax=Westerdykella ornata TaxID=318751 RepID=A0A6A6JSI4_WESOR|nr:3-oxoacyl-reductase [Westerdykella ornata]KAF2279571.1 3-oxoacyl-reductase [Westerdykella ornata]